MNSKLVAKSQSSQRNVIACGLALLRLIGSFIATHL